MISEISKILDKAANHWAILLSDGTVLNSNLDNEVLAHMIRILKAIHHNVEINNIVLFKDLIIFKLTSTFFIFLKDDLPVEELKIFFRLISQKYKDPIEKKYPSQTCTEQIRADLVLFSMALEKGPEPISYIPADYDADEITKISMKSFLALQMETEGAKEDVVAFQPLIEQKALGIVYLFQIPDENARGNAYDGTLTVLVDYKYRAIIYENHSFLESMFRQIREDITAAYRRDQDYKEILMDLKNRVEANTFETVEKQELKEEMKQQIQKLAQL
ncbi:MAG: hypothetical protein ACOC44_10645 [Promethearchaeia archaeon]